MRRLSLILAVVCLGLSSADTLAQTPGADNANNSGCPALVPQTPSADRIANARRCYRQGLELSEGGQLAQAAETFRHALQFDPEYADAYAALGRTYFKLREWQKARDNLNRAASLKSKQREANESAQIPEEAKVETVTGPMPAANKSAAVPQQTPEGARVAMSVMPAPIVKEPTGPTVSAIRPPEEISLTKIYRVGPNDVLDVRLNDSSQQSTLYTVTAAGLFEHPLLNEPIPVAGLTVEEIGKRIGEELRKRAIIEDPKAIVGVRDYASHAVLVSGLVRSAGTKFLRREAIPLYVVVADAQPLPEAAKVSVVRNESNQIYEIDLNQAADMNFLVRSGDVITLSPNTTQFVYIGGEIKFPGEKTFRRGLTLMQAILSAGGVSSKAKIAEIARDDGNGFLVATRFKLNEIVSGKAVDPVLRPGDRISILR